MVFLSICIPSYNRALFLPDLLKSIVSQYDERVEIVICDNGSTDHTEELALTWQQRYPRIVYYRFEQNVGPDRCFLQSVELASGAYTWLMGDDDILEPGSLVTVLTVLEKHPDLEGITLNRAAYDLSLQKRWIEEDSLRRKEDKLFLTAKECFEELFILFGFLSAQVVRKESWTYVTKEEKDLSSYFNAYVLVYIIGKMIQKKPLWYFIHTPCVGWRSGNDSFARELGAYRRFTLDLKGYSDICRSLFIDDVSLYRNIMNQVCSIHLVAHIRGMKWMGLLTKKTSKEIFFLSFSKLRRLRSFWMLFLPTVLSPTWLLKMVRFVYRRYRQVT